jgi:NDP-mannose synthase
MRAVILAGGRGTRLAPYTHIIPKPLLPIGDKPILETVCRQLAHAGFTHITLSLGHMSLYFKTFLAQHVTLKRLIEIDYIEETTPTGTAGSLACIPDLTSTFLVMNGDILTNLDYRALVEYHHASNACLTIAAHSKCVKIDLGILQVNAEQQVVGYIEKPTMTYPVSMGIYVYDPSVLEHITPGQHLDFPDLVLNLVRQGKKVVAFPNDATWFDLGRHEDFLAASEIFTARESEFARAA